MSLLPRFKFKHGEFNHYVYRAGEEGRPGIVLLHELPGVLPETVDLMKRLARDGYCVYMPHLFGRFGRPFSTAGTLENAASICVSKELHLLAVQSHAPLTDWLRALCREVKSRSGQPGVAVIGMCYTGAFAISLMLDDSVIAPVMSQPGHASGMHSPAAHADPGVPSADVALARKRMEAENIDILGMRFTRDPACRRARFKTFEREFGRRFRKIEIDSSLGNPYGIPASAHSVLTLEYVDKPDHPTRQAYESMLDFLAESFQRREAAATGS